MQLEKTVKETYHDNGKLARRAAYLGDMPHGPAQIFDERGVLRIECQYDHGKLHGKTLIYNEARVLTQMVEHRHGRLHGSVCVYDENGALTQWSQFRNDTLHGETLVYQNGALTARTPFVRGSIEGDLVTYGPMGKEASRCAHLAGKPNGLSLFYDPSSGHLIQKSYMRNGALDGESLSYHSNQTIRERAQYLEGNLHGEAFEYDERGKLTKRTVFREGQPVEGPIEFPAAPPPVKKPGFWEKLLGQ